MLSLLFAAATFAVAHPAAQSNDLVEALILNGDPAPGFPAPYVVRNIGDPITGRGGGWVTGATAAMPPGVPWIGVLIGQRPDGIESPVELLRQPETLHGIEQRSFTSVSMANGIVAYSASSPMNGQSAWVEDQLIARSGQPVAGAPAWTWYGFFNVEITTSGRVYVYGGALDSASNPRNVIWRWPAEELLLVTGGPDPAATHSIHEAHWYRPVVSADGDRWVATEVTPSGSVRFILDGEPFELEPGFVVEVGQPVPPSLAGPNGPATWTRMLSNLFINNRGDVVFRGLKTDAQGQETSPWIRNGRAYAALAGSGYAVGIDERGAVAIQRTVSSRVLDFEGLTALARDFDIDLDGDEIADPIVDWGPFAREFAQPNSRGSTVLSATFEHTPGHYFTGIFRGRDMRLDTPICDGVVNSTGAPGQLIAGGSRKLGDNELDLRLFGLPTGASGFVIASKTAGFASQPGGSQGDLCLGGSIGRDTHQLFTVDATGRTAVTLNLNGLPQPMGNVAATAGERWYLQAWYRDSSQGGATSNFTSASAVQFD